MASNYESEGRTFESFRAHHYLNGLGVRVVAECSAARSIQSPYNHQIRFRDVGRLKLAATETATSN